MKVIGQTNNGFLLEVSKKEIFNLIGYHSEYSSNRPNLKIGDELLISEIYNQLRWMSNNKHKISEASEKLKEIIKLMELIDPVVKDIIGDINLKD